MDTKLTLMLNKRITDSGRSAEEPNTPLVEEISGVLKLPSGFDPKKDRLRHLEARHR